MYFFLGSYKLFEQYYFFIRKLNCKKVIYINISNTYLENILINDEDYIVLYDYDIDNKKIAKVENFLQNNTNDNICLLLLTNKKDINRNIFNDLLKYSTSENININFSYIDIKYPEEVITNYSEQNNKKYIQIINLLVEKSDIQSMYKEYPYKEFSYLLSKCIDMILYVKSINEYTYSSFKNKCFYKSLHPFFLYMLKKRFLFKNHI